MSGGSTRFWKNRVANLFEENRSKRTYRAIRKQGKVNEQELAGFLDKNGQRLLPMVDLIEQCQLACDQLIDMTGRAAIQAVLQLSAMEAAGGPQQQGKRRTGDVVFYGRQAGQVLLSDHKLRNAGVPTDGSLSVGWNVLDYLPKDDRAQVKSLLRAAWKLDADKGIARIKKLAAWLDEKYPQAAASLLEGLEECFTINRLDIPPALWRCPATTNIIESPHAGVRIQTRRVTHWQNGKMVLRWMASAFMRTEKRFKRIMGHRDLWALEAILNPTATASKKVA